MLFIGIDTGKHTGFAVWDSLERKFLSIETIPIHRAMERVKDFDLIAQSHNTEIHIFFEDARLRKWYSGDTNAKAQGAGSIKRDCTIWEDFLTDYGFKFTKVAPARGMTKWSPDYFRKVTQWTQKCSEHARDAALLVFNR